MAGKRGWAHARVSRLEGAARAARPRVCPWCPALEPGGPGGPMAGRCVLLPVEGEPGRAHVACARCGRSALARYEDRGMSEPLLVGGCVAAPMPV